MPTTVPFPPIYLLTHEFHPIRGGIATFVEEMARAAAQIGHPVEVWAQNARGTPEPNWPFTLRRLPLKGSQDFTCQARLAYQLVRHRRRLRQGVLYLPEPGPMLAMMALQFFGGVRPRRLVLTFHGSEILQFYRKPITRLLTRRLLRQADRVSTLSQFTRDLLCRHFPEASPKLRLTPGALRSRVDDHDQPRLSLPPRSGKRVVLTVGRLHPRKGQWETLRALQALPPEQRARVEYWLVGGQSKKGYEQTLRSTAAASDLVVRFFGPASDAELEALYARADLFALTSTEYGDSIEGFGLVYLEAAGHGLPIVGHAIGGVAEAVVPDVTGLLVPPGDQTQLTAAFARLLSDDALRARFSAAGREWAHRHSWQRSAEVLFSGLA